MGDRQQKEVRMFEHIRQWKASGLSRRAFCRETGLPEERFTYWQKRFLQQGEPADPFVRLQPGGLNTETFELHYPNGVRLLLGGGVSLDELRMLINLA